MFEARNALGLVAVLMASAALWACPPALGDRCDEGACEPAISGDAGAEGGTTIDACLEDPSDAKCLDDDAAFFVSSTSGNDTAAGTKAAPLRTVGAALGKVSPAKKRIYLCEGAYGEDVVLDARHSGVSLFGGLTCAWTKSATRPTVGAGTTALRIADARAVAIADLAFTARDATDPGSSSIAAFVANGEVRFRRVALTAGKGAAGANGVLMPFEFPSATLLNGKDGASGGGETAVTCPGDPAGTVSTKGGKGGPSNGGAGESGSPGPDNKGTLAACETTNTGGGKGATGLPGPAGSAADKNGTLAATGWAARPGTTGAKGGPGQGGGGGAGLGGGNGGGGGAGGCGGAGGNGGQGGGASIALASFHSTVQLEASSPVSNEAGAGGAGADGQPGQSPGGFGGNPTSATSACKGGNGGPGGKGGAGGGGAGGVSVGVLYKGTAPTLDAQTTGAITLGAEGAPGAGPGNPGKDGVAEPMLAIE